MFFDDHGPPHFHAHHSDGSADVVVDSETGTVVWPGGADLAPDPLYERIRTGSWPEQDAAA